MKRKIAALLALCLTLCGCSAGASVENLLTPPRLLEEQNEIYDELKKSVGQNVKLKYPRSGDYRSAFVMYDIDDEPGDEAFVFYEGKNAAAGESALRLKFLDKNNGKWEAVYDLACAGSEVESISFARLGTGGAVDIIIRYTLLNQSEKAFSVIRYANRVPTTLYSSAYSCLEVFDINGDGMDELVTVTSDKTLNTSMAMMFTNSENGFEKLSETPLYSGAAEYLRVTKGSLNENTQALFFDYSKGSGQSGTDVLYCYGNRLFCPDSVGQNPQSSTVSRLVNDYMSEIYCYDIDGDGYIEIPSTTPLPGYEVLTLPEQLCAVMWYTVSDDNFTAKYYSYFSGKYRFALMFPSRWQGVVTAVPDFANNEIVFVSYDEEKGLVVDSSTELLRIRAVDKDDEKALADSKKMNFLGQTEETYFCYSVTKGYLTGKLALTESELNKNFFML